MGLRIYGDFNADDGTAYRIGIYDSSYSLTAVEVTVATPGFTLSYEGNNQEQYQPIIPSRLEWTFYNEGGGFDTWLNTVLPTAEEARFTVEVLTDPNEIGEAVFWRGVLLPEQIQQYDEPSPSAVNFTASDDLNELKETTVDEFTLGTGLVQYIVDALKLTRQSDLYGSTDVFLRYCNDFKTNGFTGTNFLAESGIYPPSIPGTVPTEYHNAYDTLRSICICFNARLFQAEGIWHFLPLNVYQLRSDGTSFVSDLHQYDKTATAVTWSLLDRTNWQSQMLKVDGSGVEKMAGNTIEYSRPIKRVERVRVLQGNEWLFQYNTGFTTLSSTANDIELADDDRTYFEDSTYLITLNYNININDVASDNNFINYHTVRADFTIKYGTQYWTDTGWSSTAGTKKVVIGNYYKSTGFEGIGQLSVQIPELPSDQVGLDVTLNVVVLNGAGGDIVASLPTHTVLFLLRVYFGDGTEGIGDEVVFSSETSLNNQVTLTQENVIAGNASIQYSAGGAFIGYNSGSIFATGNVSEWVSSQTTTPYTLHRLGVREILYNAQLPHRVRSGRFYVGGTKVWPYTLLREDSEDHVLHQMQLSANDCEVSMERFQLNASTANLSFRTDQIKTNNPRDKFAPNGNTYAVNIANNYDNLFFGKVAQFHDVTLIEHSSGSTHYIDVDSKNGFMYMNTYVDTANGYGVIYLPRVGENEGRMFRFKSDGTITANKYYRVGISSTQYAAGVRIDGQSAFDMNRDYDGIAVLCYDGQWYVIQRKSK